MTWCDRCGERLAFEYHSAWTRGGEEPAGKVCFGCSDELGENELAEPESPHTRPIRWEY